MAPSTTTTAPPDSTPAPADTTTAPPDSTPAPADSTTAPPNSTPAPTDTTTAAPNSTPAPADSTTVPPVNTVAPAPPTTTTAPITVTPAPPTTTTAPLITVPPDPLATTTIFGPQLQPTTTTTATSSPAPVDDTTLAPGSTTTRAASGPQIESFTGALKVSDGSVQMPDSLQATVGSVIVLSWKVADAPGGVELTDPAKSAPQKFPASVTTAEVTPAQDEVDYILVAVSGEQRSDPSTVHVSTGADQVVSPHVGLALPATGADGAPIGIVLGTLTWQQRLAEWPTGDPTKHYKLGAYVKADLSLVYTGPKGGAPSLAAAKKAVSDSLLSYLTANLESPLLGAMENADFTLTADGMTEAKAVEAARKNGDTVYTFGKLTLFEVKLSVPNVDSGVVTFALSISAGSFNITRPLSSGFGVVKGEANVILFDTKAGVKDVGAGRSLMVKGKISAQLAAQVTLLTVSDLLKRAGEDVAEDLLADTGVTFFKGLAGEVTVDGAIACASVVGSVVLIAFVGYEVGVAFKGLVQADRDNDLGIKIKFTPSYVPSVMADIRKEVELGVGLALLGATMPMAGPAQTEGGKLGTGTLEKMLEALRARNPDLEEEKFGSLFTAYMLKNKDAIVGALNPQITELTQLFSWLQLLQAGMPPFLQFDNLDEPPIISVWSVAWQAIFGDQINDIMLLASDDAWSADSNVELTGSVAGQSKWTLLQQSHAWRVAQG